MEWQPNGRILAIGWGDGSYYKSFGCVHNTIYSQEWCRAGMWTGRQDLLQPFQERLSTLPLSLLLNGIPLGKG
jgi:hypothetical protein